MAGTGGWYASEQGSAGVFGEDAGEVVGEAPMTCCGNCFMSVLPSSCIHVWVILQKNAQLSNEQLREMMEMACLWHWVAPHLKKMLGAGPGYEKLVEAWKMGILDRTTSVTTLA